ncbi:MAG TPA: hypothetical protein VI893_06950 [Thermoplasmata archaeon]|nr:hypothetical protein [Thermoplasmata archaeon]
MPKEDKKAGADTKRMNTRRVFWGVILAVFGVIFLVFYMMPVEVFGALTGKPVDVNNFFNGPDFVSAANLVKTTFLLSFVLLFILAAYDFATGAMGWGIVLPEKITVLDWERLWTPKGLESWDVLFTGKTTYTQCPKCHGEVQFMTQGDGMGRKFTCLVCNHVEPMAGVAV